MTQHPHAVHARSARRWGAWALGLGLAFAPTLALAADAIPVSLHNRRRTQIVEVVERVKDAVVNIHSERTVAPAGADELFRIRPRPEPRQRHGHRHHHRPARLHRHQSARRRGGQRPPRPPGRRHHANARVLARDPETDLALLKIDADQPLPIMPLGTAQRPHGRRNGHRHRQRLRLRAHGHASASSAPQAAT